MGVLEAPPDCSGPLLENGAPLLGPPEGFGLEDDGKEPAKLVEGSKVLPKGDVSIPGGAV